MRRYHDHLRHRCDVRLPGDDAVATAGPQHALQASVAAAAAAAGRSGRTRALPLTSLQRTQRAAGNAAVQRLLTTPFPVQRWDIKLSPTAACNDVLDHIAKSSPYRPQAAYTDAHFKFTPSVSSEKSGSKYTASVTSANVDSDITVDMPMWEPEGQMKGPWAKAWRALRDHEAKHEAVAEETKPALRNEIEAVTATGASAGQAEQAAITAAKAKWRKLLNAYQAKQKKLDPYDVDLVCP